MSGVEAKVSDFFLQHVGCFVGAAMVFIFDAGKRSDEHRRKP